MTGEEFTEYLKKEEKLAIIPGGLKFFGEESEGHVRMLIATSMEILKEGMNRAERGRGAPDRKIEQEEGAASEKQLILLATLFTIKC